MKLNLIRNLDTQRNKEQEDSFSETMNLALYFDINKSISKVDGWKLANIKKLVKSLNELDKEVDIEFSKWNKEVDYLFNNAKFNLIQFQNPSEKITNSLRNCDYYEIHNYLKEISDDKNLKLEFLFTVAEHIKNNSEATLIINEFINKGISTIDVAIDVILPLLFIEGGSNE